MHLPLLVITGEAQVQGLLLWRSTSDSDPCHDGIRLRVLVPVQGRM